LHSPADFQPGQENIILVMPTTDPAWLPLLHSAAGLIVEMGGLLSHGSIIAREYGVPGVANIPQATKHFHDGEVVLLDGSTGVVQRLARADSGEVGS
jgi:pyruvate,water dikinase